MLEFSKGTALWLLLLGISMVAAAEWTAQCDPATFKPSSADPNAPKMFVPPPVFSFNIDHAVNDEKITIFSRVAYNRLDKIATKSSYSQDGYAAKGIYNFATMQRAEIGLKPDIARHQCQVFDKPSHKDLFFYGQTPVGSSAELVTPKEIMVMDGEWFFDSTSDVRGIQANSFQQCRKFREKNSNEDNYMELSWYISDPDWNPAFNQSTVPLLLMTEYNSRVLGETVQDWYSIIGFKPWVPHPYVFNVIPGVFCKGLKQPRPLPFIPKAFSYRAEVNQISIATVGNVREAFDSFMNYSRIDYKPNKLSVSKRQKYGEVPIREVHDFRTGIAYITDTDRGNCSMEKISGVSLSDARETAANPLIVRRATAAEYFGLDGPTPQYLGNNTIRGVPCHIYSTRRTDWPINDGTKTNTTVVWYFADKIYDIDPGNEPAEQITKISSLMQMDLGIDIVLSDDLAPLSFNTRYSFYAFDADEPDWDMFDISHCYDEGSRTEYVVAFSGTFAIVEANTLGMFKDEFLIGIREIVPINPIRITGFGVSFDKHLTVHITLLGQPTIKGDVEDPQDDVSLKQAEQLLATAIAEKKFQVTVYPGGISAEPMVLTALTLNERIKHEMVTQIVDIEEHKHSGVGGGAVAGIAVGCLIGGILLGIVAIMLLTRLRGAPPPGFGNMDELNG